VQLGKRASEVFGNGFDVGTRTDRADLEKLCNQLGQHLVFASLSSAANQLSDVQEKLAGKTGPVSEALRAFVLDTITKAHQAAGFTDLGGLLLNQLPTGKRPSDQNDRNATNLSHGRQRRVDRRRRN